MRFEFGINTGVTAGTTCEQVAKDHAASMKGHCVELAASNVERTAWLVSVVQCSAYSVPPHRMEVSNQVFISTWNIHMYPNRMQLYISSRKLRIAERTRVVSYLQPRCADFQIVRCTPQAYTVL